MPDWDDTDYSTLAVDYANVRRPDPRIGAQLLAALGPARTVLNVGAGTGSYEPTDRTVVAVEPSAEMRAMRPPLRPTLSVESTPVSGSSTRPPRITRSYTMPVTLDLSVATGYRQVPAKLPARSRQPRAPNR